MQISDALVFLHSLDYLHCAISSHAVQLVNTNIAKLCQLEFLVNYAGTGGEELARHSQALLDYAKTNEDTLNKGRQDSLLNWLSPESVSKSSDVCSLCCVVYELATGVSTYHYMLIITIMQGHYLGIQRTEIQILHYLLHYCI